jgi:hypothetical protein
MPELDDELIARALHAELNGTVEASSAHNADAELAKRLQEECLKGAPASPAQHGDDEELARRLEAELNAPPPVDASDEELARRIQEAEQHEEVGRGPGAMDDASLALALSLETEQAAQNSARDRRRQREGEQLRQHLFCGGGTESGYGTAGGGAASFPSAPVRSAVSYAHVVGEGEQRSGMPQLQPPPMAPRPFGLVGNRTSAAAIHGGAAAGAPLLIIDGANVATNHAGYFDAQRLLRCVDYFVRRSGLSGTVRRLPRSRISVVLNENRYDPSDEALLSLEDVIMWTPTAKDDDVFLLQCAADHESWVVTNDRWTDHRALRHATQDVRKRKITYAWAGSTFAPASDDLRRFDSSASGADQIAAP